MCPINLWNIVEFQGHIGFLECFFHASYCLNELAAIHIMSHCCSLDGGDTGIT